LKDIGILKVRKVILPVIQKLSGRTSLVLWRGMLSLPSDAERKARSRWQAKLVCFGYSLNLKKQYFHWKYQ
jgi:hypothetical protein